MKLFGISLLLCFTLFACSKENLQVPPESMGNGGGDSINAFEKWTKDLAIDTAISTATGKKLLEHLEGLSAYLENVTEQVRTREDVDVVQPLPAINPENLRTNDMEFYQMYVKKQQITGWNNALLGNSFLPFQKLSSIAIQIQLTQMKLDTSERENKGQPST